MANYLMLIDLKIISGNAYLA